MKNCICVLGMRISAKMINSFINIFVALYLWDLTNGSIPVLCKYYVIFIICIYSAMFLSAPVISKRKGRKWALVAGLFLQVCYFLSVYIFKSECVNHVALLAAMNGVANGIYYSIYNLYEAEGIDNDIRPKAMGYYGVIEGFFEIGFPIFSGIIITMYGMRAGVIAAMLVACISVMFAVSYTDNGDSVGKLFSFKKLFHVINSSKNIKKHVKTAAVCDICKAYINSFGSFELFIQVWMMLMFAGAAQLGSISGISSGFRILFCAMFAKLGSKMHRRNVKVYIFLRILVVISLIGMTLTGNAAGLIIMTLCLNCSNAIESPMYGCGITTLSNSGCISEYKSEFYVLMETFLTIARLTGYGMLWLWGAVNNTAALVFCIVVYSFILLITPMAEDKLFRAAYDVA